MLSVRELEEKDIGPLSDYWFRSDDKFLIGMGVDLAKMPEREEWETMLREQLSQTYKEKRSYCIIWEDHGRSIGHSNVNKIVYGEEAYMHLHAWHHADRQRGMGVQLIKKTLPYFFKNLKLKKVLCEPYALNAAPNNALPKAGFKFVKKYVTIPGFINFEQEVNLWQMTKENFNKLK
jgi:ribosomal-protein-alanine N-acetyltransferase